MKTRVRAKGQVGLLVRCVLVGAALAAALHYAGPRWSPLVAAGVGAHVAVALAFVAIWRADAQARLREARGLCPRCGYDLRRSPTGRCPKCGGGGGRRLISR